MRPHRALMALLAFGGLAIFMPVVDAAALDGLPSEVRFAAFLFVPAVASLYAVSWAKPELTWPVVGFFVLAGIMALAPTLAEVALAGTRFAGGGMAGVAFSLALPVVVLALLASAMGVVRQ